MTTRIFECGVKLAQVPGLPLPDGFQSWPVTAILGLITLSSLAALVFVFRNTYKTMHESSVVLAKLAAEQDTANAMTARTNDLLQEMVANLKARPCLNDTIIGALHKSPT